MKTQAVREFLSVGFFNCENNTLYGVETSAVKHFQIFFKVFFKAFDYKCGIAAPHLSFFQSNYFCKASLKRRFCVLEIWGNSQRNIRNDKKSSLLTINNCIKNEHLCITGNFPKQLQKLSQTIIYKNIFQQLFLLLLLPFSSLNRSM